jgi:hypothetical protein
MFVYCTTTMASLGSMAQWGLDGGHALMDTSRVVALSGVVVVPMLDLVRGFASVYHSEDGWK